MFVIPAVVLDSEKDPLAVLTGRVAEELETVVLAFDNPNHMAFNVERVQVSPDGASLLRSDDTAVVMPLESVEVPEGSYLTDFIEDANKPVGSSIAYQVSPASSLRANFSVWWVAS